MKKKELFAGIIIGSALTATGAFAVQYVATDNAFPVTLNGSSVNLQGYNIEGNTYFKLRDIADTIGGFSVGFENNTITLTTDSYNSPQANRESVVSGYVGDNKYFVEIMGARTTNDKNGNPVIIVEYRFTNNSDKNTSFLTAISTNAFQNRIQCETTYMPDLNMNDLTKIQPGGTILVEQAYKLFDTANDVTIEVSTLFSLDDNIVSWSFDI